MQDALGDRIKGEYENPQCGQRFHGRPLIVVARIDGRAFHSFTEGMTRPFDTKLTLLMQDTTRYLVEETVACTGYTQSDEITLVWYSDDFHSQIFFDGRIAKMTSILAAMTTAKFNQLLPSYFDDYYAKKLPLFDCRVFSVPTKTEAANIFVWREQDAVRNSVQMLAQSLYSHSELQGKNSAELQEMIFKRGLNWNKLSDAFKRGSYYQRFAVERPFTTEEIEKLPAKHEARKNPNMTIVRHEIRRVNMPVFTTVVNRKEVIFDGATPFTGEYHGCD